MRQIRKVDTGESSAAAITPVNREIRPSARMTIPDSTKRKPQKLPNSMCLTSFVSYPPVLGQVHIILRSAYVR